MTTERENELLKMIRRLENALVMQAAMTNKVRAGTQMQPISDEEMAAGERGLLGTEGVTVGQTVLEASRNLRAKFAQ